MTEYTTERAELVIRFALLDGETLETVSEEFAEDLDEARRRVGALSAHTRFDDVGVGFSADGFAVVLDIARAAVDDLDRLVAIGGTLLWLKNRLRRRGERMTVISNGPALGAVAASEATADGPDLTGYRFSACRPLTGWPEVPEETDERHVWAAVFENEAAALVTVLFMSPAGVVLGSVVVPVHGYWDEEGWHIRSVDELRSLFGSANRRSP